MTLCFKQTDNSSIAPSNVELLNYLKKKQNNEVSTMDEWDKVTMVLFPIRCGFFGSQKWWKMAKLDYVNWFWTSWLISFLWKMEPEGGRGFQDNHSLSISENRSFIISKTWLTKELGFPKRRWGMNCTCQGKQTLYSINPCRLFKHTQKNATIVINFIRKVL